MNITATISTLIFMCFLRIIWVRFVFPLCPTLTFLYLVWPIGWILCIIVALCVFFPTLSKLQKINQSETENKCSKANLK